MSPFATTTSGRERWPGNTLVPRHRHAEAYAALVLGGGYEECGSRGRFRVGPGDALLHDAFDAHLDRFDRHGAVILNLPICADIPFGWGSLDDPDEIARMAECDEHAAAALLCERLHQKANATADWPEQLATDLLADPACRLDDWARGCDLAAETVSRGFGRVFGLTPAAFRAEARTRRALYRITRTSAPLAEIAAAAGFADQAHMTRAVKALTGLAPGAWRRRSNPFKTAVRPAA